MQKGGPILKYTPNNTQIQDNTFVTPKLNILESQDKIEKQQKEDVDKTIKNQEISQLKKARTLTDKEKIYEQVNKQYFVNTHPYTQLDNQGNIIQTNPDRGFEGQPLSPNAQRWDKGLSHIQGALDAAGIVVPITGGLSGITRELSLEIPDVYWGGKNYYTRSSGMDAVYAKQPEYNAHLFNKQGYITPTQDKNLMGYIKSEIDWGKWNKEIPDNEALIQEYHNIEQTSKANGTWMKNPNGSPFQGTPEQFVQQNSENFKKAFGNSKLINPDGSPTIQYHGSAKKFDTFDESKFQLGDSGYSGQGIYTTPSKVTADSYTTSSAKLHTGDITPTVYELYGKADNPIAASQLIKDNKNYDLFNFHRNKNWQGDVPLNEQLREYDAAISDQHRGIENIRPWNDAREIVFPSNKQLKSATGNNGMFDMTNPNIYKALFPTAIGTIASTKSKQYKQGGIIKDDEGQWNHPGEITEIQGNNMATHGYGDIPLYVVPDVGEPRIIEANSGNHIFPGATKFTEYPMKKKSKGWLDKYN